MIIKSITLDFRNKNTWPTTNRVNAIRAIRILTGQGLKESKDIVDSATGLLPTHCYVVDSTDPDTGRRIPAAERFDHALDLLKSAGITVYNEHSQLLEQLRTTTIEAVQRGRLELAEDLISLLRKFS